MKIRDLLPFNWKKESTKKDARLPQRAAYDRSPFGGIFSDFDQMFDKSFGNFGLMNSEFHRSLSPNVNVSETKKEIRIEAELPGMDEKDINVTIENGYLTIRGEKKHESRDEKAHRIESSYGFFERTLPLPDYANAENAKAKYKRGVLTLSIPKEEQKEKGKNIPILVG